MKWYYYLHTDGNLIGKNPVVVDSDAEYFNSPFVKKTWLIDTADRSDAWNLVLEALALGAAISRIKGLVDKWGLTFEDSKNMLVQNLKPSKLAKDGMTIFIKQFLNMPVDEYWDKIKLLAEEG